LVKLKHVGAFIVNLNVNFNILKQYNCALVGQIKDLMSIAACLVIILAYTKEEEIVYRKKKRSIWTTGWLASSSVSHSFLTSSS
jgi:hypothetical protein